MFYKRMSEKSPFLLSSYSSQRNNRAYSLIIWVLKTVFKYPKLLFRHPLRTTKYAKEIYEPSIENFLYCLYCNQLFYY